jgi:hypothetical protein
MNDECRMMNEMKSKEWEDGLKAEGWRRGVDKK